MPANWQDDVPAHWPRMPATPSKADARSAAQAALALLVDSNADGQNIYRGDLNAAIDPLRGLPPLGVRCGKCGRGLGFIGLQQQTALLLSGNKRPVPKRRGPGEHGLANHTDFESRNVSAWVQDAKSQRGTVRDTGEAPGVFSGFDERRTFTCRRCGATYTHTNTGLLRRYLTAISCNSNEFSL